MADLDSFDFVGYEIRTKFPRSPTIQMGSGYEVNPTPVGGEPRNFYLTFKDGLGFYTDEDGEASTTVEPTKNVYALEAFYLDHKAHVNFTLDHPIYGTLTVHFSATNPFETPKSKTKYWSEGFEIVLVEVL